MGLAVLVMAAWFHANGVLAELTRPGYPACFHNLARGPPYSRAVPSARLTGYLTSWTSAKPSTGVCRHRIAPPPVVLSLHTVLPVGLSSRRRRDKRSPTTRCARPTMQRDGPRCSAQRNMLAGGEAIDLSSARRDHAQPTNHGLLTIERDREPDW